MPSPTEVLQDVDGVNWFSAVGSGDIFTTSSSLLNSEHPLSKVTALLSGGVTVSGGHVYIGSEKAQLYALNTSDGTVAWQTRVAGEALSRPVVSHGTIAGIQRIQLRFLAADINMAARDGHPARKQRWRAREPAIFFRQIHRPHLSLAAMFISAARKRSCMR